VAVVISIAVADFGLYVGYVDFASRLRASSATDARIKKAFVGGFKFEAADKALEKRLDTKLVRKPLNELIRSEYKAGGVTVSVHPSGAIALGDGFARLEIRTTMSGTTSLMRSVAGIGGHSFGCAPFAELADAVDAALAAG
jgi:hypothetical protein